MMKSMNFFHLFPLVLPLNMSGGTLLKVLSSLIPSNTNDLLSLLLLLKPPHFLYFLYFLCSLVLFSLFSKTGLYWNKCDETFKKFEKYKKTLVLPPPSIKKEIKRVCKILKAKGRHTLCRIFEKTFPNTLETAVTMLHDGTAFVITGDIPLMWLRDSAAQVNPYIPLAKDDPYLQIIIEGVIRRDIKWIKMDPYGSSFRMFLDFDHAGKEELTDWDYRCGRTAYVAQHDYEMDSLTYFIKLSYDYWKSTGISAIFDEDWREAIVAILDTWDIEQNHNSKSQYTYPTLLKDKGSTTCDNKLLWVGMRPSDDSCKYHFLIPANMMAVTSLRQLNEIFTSFFPEDEIIYRTSKMADEVEQAIKEHAIFEHEGKEIYAYEVDGCGNKNMMDDANIPSLLSIPYIGFKPSYDPNGKIEKATRNWILSKSNPYFFSNSQFEGIGSPHTPGSNVWHLAIIMRALTSNDPVEINKQISMLERSVQTVESNSGSFLMHESFSIQNPNKFTRHWFSWANSLFAEMILKKLDVIEVQKPASHLAKSVYLVCLCVLMVFAGKKVVMGKKKLMVQTV
eukprot:TRINITY_DN2339_c0_g1_i3.p1 TRINITY_DN2339_c0_g1~~TRINITY_DN2339_c0_g1_i3.p1  ORF type:complete len:564 (+),score=71.19 TRINITY_DN2339_c0_g1_i3:407-2098(+)